MVTWICYGLEDVDVGVTVVVVVFVQMESGKKTSWALIAARWDELALILAVPMCHL
jgi:hypothetical protein